jgi:hypothetical protein
VAYATFNKAAAADTRARLARSAGSAADCRTLHSLAFELVGVGLYKLNAGDPAA